MNRKREKTLRMLTREFDSLYNELSNIASDEESSRENMPEAFENTESYTRSEEASDHMSNALDYISNAIEELDEI